MKSRLRRASKGRETIPTEAQERLELSPHPEVHFEERGRRLLERMRGRATSGMSTEEIMSLTRPC
jgi:hypothetical protein